MFSPVATSDYQAILGLVAVGIGVALVPRMSSRRPCRKTIVAPPRARRGIRRRVEVAPQARGYLPPVTQELVGAPIAAATGLDQPASR